MSSIRRTVAVVAVVAAVLSAPLAATPKSTRRLAPRAPVPTVDGGPIIDPDGSPTPAPTVDGGPLIDPDGAR